MATLQELLAQAAAMEGGAMPDMGPIMPPAPLPGPGQFEGFDEFAPQEQMPDDYFARLAQQSGGQGPFQNIRMSRNPTGLEALLGLVAGFTNAKTRGAAGRMSEVDERNQRTRAAASELGKRRWEVERDRRREAERMKLLIAASQAKAETAADPLVDVVDPNTGKTIKVRRSQAEGMQTGYSPQRPMAVMDPNTGQPVLVSPPSAVGREPATGRRKPSASERERLIDDANVIGQTDVISGLHKQGFTGPARGRFGGWAAKIDDRLLSPGEADFRSSVAIYVNKARNMLFGSALTATEQAAAMQQLPDPKDPSDVFRAKLEQTRQNLIRAANLRRQTYEGTGLDLSEIPKIPGVSEKKRVRWTTDSAGNPVRAE